MDDFHERQLRNLRDRHERKIREAAEGIQEYIGYVLTRLDSGHPESVDYYAAGIAAEAHDIVRRLAALEAMADAVGILETTDRL